MTGRWDERIGEIKEDRNAKERSWGNKGGMRERGWVDAERTKDTKRGEEEEGGLKGEKTFMAVQERSEEHTSELQSR